MKKILFFAVIAAVLSLASCQKEEPVVFESPVFTATIDTGSKTVVNAKDGKVSWEESDEITVTDKDKKTAVYKIKSIDGTTGKANFTYKSGDTLGEGPYNATYGTEPAAAQTYSAIPGKLHMTAQSSTTSLTFSVQCGLMEINLTKAGKSVKNIAVTGIPTGGSETTYTLTCTDVQSIAAKTAFYIAVPAGSYNRIVITDSDKCVCTLTAASGIVVQANHIKPVTIDEGKLDFLPAGVLKGKFSVSDTKKIHFSQGNLYWDETNKKFGFEANQYDFQNKWYGTYLVSHFYWSRTDSVTYVKYYKESGTGAGDVFFTNATAETAKADFSIGGVTGKFRTLSKKEWQYLFAWDSSLNGGNGDFDSKSPRYRKYKLGVKVCGKANCVVLKPDDYIGDAIEDEYDDASWKKAEAAGLVCLPAAGYRDTSEVRNCNNTGAYWSSSAIDAGNAYYVGFSKEEINFDPDPKIRKQGNSVRLVTDQNP